MPVYWDDGTELFHYGVVGMKWGVGDGRNSNNLAIV